MSLRKCPDCDHYHRGRAAVCRPCARKRLIAHAKLKIVSCETPDPNALQLARDIVGEMEGVGT